MHIRHEFRAYPTRQNFMKQEAAAEAFCNLYNTTLIQSMERSVRREIVFSCLLESPQLISVGLFRPRLIGQYFRAEQAVASLHLHKAIKALLRLLGARCSEIRDDGLGNTIRGRMGFSGQIRTHGRRLPWKPKFVVLTYWHGAWFICFSDNVRVTAYRLKTLSMTYRAMTAMEVEWF